MEKMDTTKMANAQPMVQRSCFPASPSLTPILGKSFFFMVLLPATVTVAFLQIENADAVPQEKAV